MMRMKFKSTEALSSAKGGSAGGVNVVNWEIRPSGMVVQRRNSDSNPSSASIPSIKVKVKYGSSSLEISISSQASFGELKKMLAEPTGLHPQDQKLIFKNKERDSKAYLDDVGVKDGSKIVLVEDIIGRERRLLELRKYANMEKASKAIKDISLEVDKLAGQVKALESAISSGGKVLDMDVLNLIELLMTQVIKLDGIVADGDVKLQRRLQIRRVQKYVETLDQLKLKIQNSMSSNNTSEVPLQRPQQHSAGQTAMPLQQYEQQGYLAKTPILQQSSRHLGSAPVVVTTKWETFDSGAAHMPFNSVSKQNSMLNWEFFE